jgi:hypothetical protein
MNAVSSQALVAGVCKLTRKAEQSPGRAQDLQANVKDQAERKMQKSSGGVAEGGYKHFRIDATPHPNTVTNASNAYKDLSDGRNVLPYVICEKIDNAISAT